MEPTFKYIKNPESGNAESVAIETKSVGEQNKEAEKIVKKKKKRYGSSLGWGWFQGFNLFVNGCFLLMCLVFAYFMLGGEERHQGLPKYVLDRSNNLGMVIFNPQIPENIRQTFVYRPPIVRVKEDKPIEKPNFGEIQLLSSVQQDNSRISETLPELSLISSSSDGSRGETQGNQQAPQKEVPFYGDSPFSEITLDSLQSSETNAPSQNSQQGNNTAQGSEVDHLNALAIDAIKKGKLVEPYEGSALSYYNQILEISPNHPYGIDGIMNIANTYLQKAKEEMHYGRNARAKTYIQLGLEADPFNPELNQMFSDFSE